jgi:hypothetical protein
MNELLQLLPVLLIQAGNVVSVDLGEVGFNHGNFSCASAAYRVLKSGANASFLFSRRYAT